MKHVQVNFTPLIWLINLISRVVNEQGVHWCHGTWKVMEKSWKMKQGHGNTWNVMENELGVMENNLGEGIKKF